MSYAVDDPFRLQRFIDAQAPIYFEVQGELRRGRKHSHWMWFIFPQVSGLGVSPTAQYYAIASRDEAKAYLAHPQLGQRLDECTRLVLAVADKTAHEIFGSPDDLKFKSSMTLFDTVAPGSLYADALARFYSGSRDERTLERL
jgi:uncharacterized protein (DUF1810 family)